MAYFAKFTERGQRALLTAQREAAQLGRTYVGTEHLLLGVLSDPGAASVVLKGITLDAAREEIIQILGRGDDDSPVRTMVYTPRTKKVLEQSVRTGGCIHYAGGTVSGAGFKIQKENGVEDTPEAFYADIEALGGEGEFNEALAKRHTEEAGAAIDWLDEDLGVDFGDRSLVGGAYTAMQTLRVTRALGSYSMGAANAYLDPLNERLEQAIADGKAQIMYNTKVTELLVEGDKCVGVKAGDLEFRAPSVVLATGGYSYNEDLLKMAGFENVISCAPSTSDGSGFLLAQAVGGVFDNMDEIVNYYGGGIPTNGFDMYYQVNNSYPGMIYVNAQGDRVGAEESATSAMWYGQEESKLYAVISGNMIDKEQAFIKHPMMNSAVLENNGWDKLEGLAAAGNCVYKADTLEELAEMIGAENLTATVEAYNKDVAAGEDTAFGRAAESMVAFEEGPYYAVVTVPYVWSGTSGGVRANEDGYHYVGAQLGRDFQVDEWADLCLVREGDPCPKCGLPLSHARGIEVGQIFKLGDKYSRSMDVKFMDENGEERYFIMGCYGVGVSRTLAAAVEQSHDDKGIIWPFGIAPAHICVIPLTKS